MVTKSKNANIDLTTKRSRYLNFKYNSTLYCPWCGRWIPVKDLFEKGMIRPLCTNCGRKLRTRPKNSIGKRYFFAQKKMEVDGDTSNMFGPSDLMIAGKIGTDHKEEKQ